MLNRIWKIFSKIWGILFVIVLTATCLSVSNQLSLPFMRTLVICKNNATRPIIAYNSQHWSGSLYCDNKDYVIGIAQRRVGYLTAVKLVSRIIGAPFLGSAADFYGRKKILYIGICGVSLSFFLTYQSSKTNGKFQLIWLIIAYIIHGLTTIFGPIFAAILANSSSVEDRPAYFTFFGIISLFATIFATVISTMIKKHYLIEYQNIYAFLIGGTLLSLPISILFIHENENNEEEELTDKYVDFLSCFKLFRHSKFLIAFSFGIFLYVIGVMSLTILSSFTMSVYGWRQGDLIIKFFPFAVLAMVSMLSSSRMILKFKSECVLSAAVILVVLAIFSLNMAPYSSVPIIFAGLFFSLSVVGTPAYFTEATKRFDTKSQTQVQAILNLCATLAAALSSVVYPNFLFKASARGFRAGLPFLVGFVSSLFGAGIMIYAIHKVEEKKSQDTFKDKNNSQSDKLPNSDGENLNTELLAYSRSNSN